MNASRRSHDAMHALGGAQAQLLKQWMDATWGLSGVRGAFPWSDPFGAWQRFLTEAMEFQIEWTRRWVTSFQDVYGGRPEGTPRPKVGVNADPTVKAQPARSWAEQGFPRSTGRDRLIQAVVNASGADAEHAARAVDAILDGIAAALVQGEEVRLPGFGSFKVIDTHARVGRNPRTNEPVVIPAGHKAVFRPALNLRKSVS